MKYFIDTEFHEDGRTIDLISIGVVCEDGREFYAVNADCDWDRIWTLDSCKWLRENVMSNIDRSDGVPSSAIRDDLRYFICDEKPEFWGYYADYDWVVFCQLFGRMIDLPDHFPKFCRDIKQFAVGLGDPNIPVPEINEHHALADARWNKQAYDFLANYARECAEQDRLRLPLKLLGVQQ